MAGSDVGDQSASGDNYSPDYRQFYLDDRDRTQAKFEVDVKVLE